MAGDKVIVRIDGDDSGFQKSLSGIGATAKKSLGVAVKGIAATSAAIGGLAVAAVKGYADCEQLVGGIETLFGTKGAKSVQEYAKSVGKSVAEVQGEYTALNKSQQQVINNANKAYKTAGLSANEYMETVTSFAASLKQSFADTPEGIAAAGEAADKAIQDMADNSNKMGTAMESIQMAYQGFAKQNYTMLDNLKLGYGGTKTEMERLLADAQKLSGVKYDISNLADVYEAIHVIQTEIGITGTTAKEAEQTITGSVNMMKASWKNLVVGMADENADLDELIENFIDSLMTVGDNILPVFENALSGIGEFIGQAADRIIPKMVDIIIEALPTLANAATLIIISLAEAIISNLPLIIDAAKQIVIALSDALGDAVPALKPITNLMSSLASNIESVIPVIGGAVIAYKAYQVAVTVANAAQIAFNSAMVATPWGAIIALIGAAGGMIVGYATATREQTEAERESATAIKERADSFKNLQKSCLDAASSAETEAAMSRNLSSELRSIVDENGRVKEGYEARAAVITGELNAAFGTEMSIIDGTIAKYQEEMATIDQLIEKKRAAAIVDAERPQYTEAVSQYNNALKQQAEITAQIAEQQAIINDENSSNVAAQEAFAAIDELEAQLEANQTLLDGYTQTITTYEQNMEALATGAYDTIRSINDATAKEIANASTLQAAEAAVQTAVNTYTVGLESCKRQGTEMTASMKSSIANNIKDAILKVAELGGEIPEGISIAIEGGKPAIVNSVDEILAIVESGLTPGGQIASAKGTEATTNYAAALAQGKGPIETSARGVAEAGWVAAGNISAPVTAAQTLTERFSLGIKSNANQFKTSGEESATEYSAGIEAKTSEVESSAKKMVDSGLNSAKSEQDKAAGGAQSLGEDFSSGYAKGITAGKNEAVNAAVDLAKAALQAVKDAQDSDSPAKETQKLGNDFGDGYALGINDNSDGAIEAASNMADSTVDVLSKNAYEDAYKAGNAYSAGFAAGIAEATDDAKTFYSELHDATLKDLGYDTLDDARKRNNQITQEIANLKGYRENATLRLSIATWSEQIKALEQEVSDYNTAIDNLEIEREVIQSAMAKAEIDSDLNMAGNSTKSNENDKGKSIKENLEESTRLFEHAIYEAGLLYEIWEETDGRFASSSERRQKAVEKLNSQIENQSKIVEENQKAYELAKKTLGETDEVTLELKNSVLKTTKELSKLRSESEEITDSLSLIAKETSENIELIEAKYELWCSATKTTATEEEKAAKKTEYLNAKLFEQGRYVAELEKRHNETVAKYGETAEASKALEKQLYKEKDAWVDINNELNKHTNLEQHEIYDAAKTYNDFIAKNSGELMRQGVSYEEIVKIAADVSGWNQVLSQSEKSIEKLGVEASKTVYKRIGDGLEQAVSSEDFSEAMTGEASDIGKHTAKSFVQTFINEMGSVPDGFFDYGEKSAESFEEGFMRKFKNVMSSIKTRIEEEINSIIAAAAEKGTGNTTNTTQINYNDTYIVQPSAGESTQAQLSAIADNKLVNDTLRN